MPQETASDNPAVDTFVREVIQQHRTKLLDLTSRNPLISFRHSERSRSHIRIIDEIPEVLFSKLGAGKELFFTPLPDPDMTPGDENAPAFLNLLRRAMTEDQVYRQALAELGPAPSARQRQKIDRELRNRLRVQLGLSPFQPTWDPQRRAKEIGLNPDYDLPKSNGHLARRHADLNLQTLFFSENLDRKLGGLRDSARILEKDAGFNALFCAFGYLEYYESEKSDERRVAPLVFLPVTLDRVLRDQQYRYFIKTRNEDVESNVALAELLKKMGINLPAWDDDDSTDTPLGNYLDRVERAITGKQDWKVRRYVTVGLFTFSTLAMYKDLDPQRWPTEAPIEQHPVLRTLIAGAEISDVQYADDYEIDKLQGPEPLLITDADSSQHSAVVDVLRGKSSQVIQGPPGTGKSQTITNIIAAALNEGLSVLFVAEKMAALEVVKKRLDAAGLEAFCLELHSSKASKTTVIESISRRLDYRGSRLSPEAAQSNAGWLHSAKTDLLHYVQRINQDAGSTGLKNYDILLGSAIRDALRANLPPAIAEARFSDPLNISAYTYRQMLDAADTLEKQTQILTGFGSLSEHPWRGIQNVEITELDEGRLADYLSEWNKALRRVIDGRSLFINTLSVQLPETREDLERFCRRLIELDRAPSNLMPELYKDCADKCNSAALKASLLIFAALRRVEDVVETLKISRHFAHPVESQSVAATLSTLRELGMEDFSVASVVVAQRDERQLAILLAQLEPVCTSLAQIAVLHDLSLKSLRAAVVAVEAIQRLPRSLWTMRSSAVLDDANTPLLEHAMAQATSLLQRREGLEAQFDLQLAPNYQELRRLGSALRSTGALASLFSSECRFARRTYRTICRAPSKKRRQEMADDLLRCAQYLADAEAFRANATIRVICGAHYAELETPFAEIIKIAHWATETRQKLASFGEPGILVRDFLFNASANQLDQFRALHARDLFDSLREVLGKNLGKDDLLWGDLIRRQQVRAESIGKVADVFERARFHDGCQKREVDSAYEALSTIEQSVSAIASFREACQRLALKYAALIESDQRALRLIGGSVRNLRDNLDAITATLNFVETVSSWALPQEFIRYFLLDAAHITQTQYAAQELLAACGETRLREDDAKAFAQIDSLQWCGAAAFDNAPFNLLLERNANALNNLPSLRDYLNFLLAEDYACDQGIGPVLSVFSEAGIDYRNLKAGVEFVFFRSAAEGVLNNDPRLRTHSGATHQKLRSQFQTLDRESLELHRKQLAIKLTYRPCPPGNAVGPASELTEGALVRRVAGQTRPRVTMRDLIRRSGNALQALMPCWMMSPASVAQYLEPGRLRFDLVIMDEASQIRPEEALGALARGNKAVVVGDQMQLPPTPFFQKLSVGDVTDEDEFEETKQESILEAAAGRFHPSRRLKWHYRSEHPSLIAFSNHEFYGDQLTVFPSPNHEHPEFGASFVQTGGIYEAGLNESEGRAVVTAAIAHMRKYPSQSLGIVAVNSKQAEFIRELLDRECTVDENAAAYVQKWDQTLESVFVKNLENVQGDERDVIFISTVYGKDSKGAFHQRFGPINGIYGHRRLNVLFTRAKKKVTVFTSLVPEEIEDEGKHWGVRVLKGYLQFARDGLASIPSANGECDSEFEQWVLQVLQSHGYQGVPQVGVCGYRIDIGVKHPGNPGVFLCGIECDGATYHSARSVRERDRLRQEVLERYGWKLFRIWSTDWFRNPSLQTKQMLAYLQQLHPPISAM